MRVLFIANWAAAFAAAIVCVSAGEDITLPKGFPDPFGTSERYGPHFRLTTAAYEKEARRLVLEEATKVATELGLPEELPLTESNIVEAFIPPFGYAYMNKAVGNVDSRHYTYIVGKGWRFSRLVIANSSGVEASYARKYRWPRDRLDTNAAYNLATQWLAAVSMDVAGLNRDCVMHAAPDSYRNRFRWNTPFTNATFTPIYSVYWIPRQTTNESLVAASVGLFAPDKTLLGLTVENPVYSPEASAIYKSGRTFSEPHQPLENASSPIIPVGKPAIVLAAFLLLFGGLQFLIPLRTVEASMEVVMLRRFSAVHSWE